MFGSGVQSSLEQCSSSISRTGANSTNEVIPACSSSTHEPQQQLKQSISSLSSSFIHRKVPIQMFPSLLAIATTLLSSSSLSASLSESASSSENSDAVENALTAPMTESLPGERQPRQPCHIVGLYFSAGWCPDCIHTTPALEDVILFHKKQQQKDKLKHQKSDDKHKTNDTITNNDNNNTTSGDTEAKAEPIVDDDDDDIAIDIIYVSSDMTLDDMKLFKPSIFLEIPFEHMKERREVKKYFGTCAMKEMNDLAMTITDRKHGIPTLIFIDPYTWTVITENGMDAIDKYYFTTSSSETKDEEEKDSEDVEDDVADEQSQKHPHHQKRNNKVLDAWYKLCSSIDIKKAKPSVN